MHVTLCNGDRWDTDLFRTELSEHNVTINDGRVDDIDHDTQALCIFIESTIDDAILDELDELELISTMSTGYDHIDLDACNSHDVTVCNVPQYGQNTVAEHTFALILSLSRKLYPSIKRTHEHHRFYNDEDIRGFDLKGKTIGIIGCGSIGRHVARMARGFQMNILGYDVCPDADFAERIGMEYTSVDDILERSDIITLHVPLTDDTHHLIDDTAVEHMNGAMLINTSRGEVIDTDALVNGLNTDAISYAGLDVLEDEDIVDEDHVLGRDDIEILLENHMLMRRDDVIITPHNAFNSVEALERIVTTTTDNIKSYARGDPTNVVT